MIDILSVCLDSETLHVVGELNDIRGRRTFTFGNLNYIGLTIISAFKLGNTRPIALTTNIRLKTKTGPLQPLLSG